MKIPRISQEKCLLGKQLRISNNKSNRRVKFSAIKSSDLKALALKYSFGGNSIFLQAVHKGTLDATYDSLLGFGFDTLVLHEKSILCSKDLSSNPKSHIRSYDMEFAKKHVLIRYLPQDGDKLAHAEAVQLLLSFFDALGSYSANMGMASRAIAGAIEKSL